VLPASVRVSPSESVSLESTLTVSGLSSFVVAVSSAASGGALISTPVCSVAALFAGFVSLVVLVTEAELLMVDGALAVGRTTIVVVADDPFERSPRAHVTVPVVSEHPEEAETKVTPAGSESVRTVLFAELGPGHRRKRR
jgi:hypothetical protein